MASAIRSLRKHLTYANVGVTICLVVLLGSATAVAAGRLGSADIVDNSIKSRDIRNGTLGQADMSSRLRASLTDTSPWEKIPSGTTVRGGFQFESPIVAADMLYSQSLQLPALPSAVVGSDDVNFSKDDMAETIDDDETCTGSSVAPTAPAGKICIYLAGRSRVTNLQAFGWSNAAAGALGLFYLTWHTPIGSVIGQDSYIYGTWAYTAP